MPTSPVEFSLQGTDRQAEAEAMFFNLRLPQSQRTLIAIANKLGVAPGTVRNWAWKGQWTERRKALIQKASQIQDDRFAQIAARGVSLLDKAIRAGEKIAEEIDEVDETGQPKMTREERLDGLVALGKAIKPFTESLARLTGEEERSKIRVSQAAPNKPTIHAQNVAVIGNDSNGGRPSFWTGGARQIGSCELSEDVSESEGDEGDAFSGEGDEGWMPQDGD